jgi:hypothetical protein
MWRTGIGDRAIKGAEWALFREALWGLWDRVDEAGDEWDDQPLGVDLFDELQAIQKLAMLAIVVEALSREDVEAPELTAVGEATIAAVFAFLMEDIALDIETEGEDIPLGEGEEATEWTAGRKLLLAAYVEANPDDDDNEGEDGGTVDASSDDLELWASMIEDMENRILWEDGDYQMGREFLDASQATRARLLKRSRIDEGYFLAIAPDPTDLQMDAVRQRLRALTGRGARTQTDRT